MINKVLKDTTNDFNLPLKIMQAVTTHHLFDFNLGGAFLGIKKRALMGCMSQSAAKQTTKLQ